MGVDNIRFGSDGEVNQLLPTMHRTDFWQVVYK